MKKIFRNYIVRCVAVFGLWFVTGLELPSNVLAQTLGQITLFTPFDHKISASGVFSGSFKKFGAGQSMDLRRLFDISRSFRYVSDPRGDHWQSPSETESRRAGDCEDKSIWLFSRLKMNGYQNLRLVVGKYRPTDRQYHV